MTAAFGITCPSSDCRTCELKARCTRAPFRKIARDINEEARDYARSLMGTPAFEQSRDDRKKVEIRFAHLRSIIASSVCDREALAARVTSSSSPPSRRTSKRLLINASGCRPTFRRRTSSNRVSGVSHQS